MLRYAPETPELRELPWIDLASAPTFSSAIYSHYQLTYLYYSRSRLVPAKEEQFWY